MQLPAIRERISQLPRTHKILFSVLLIIILALIAEGSYYFWTLRKGSEESKYINTDIAYQKGPYLYSRENDEVVAIRGWIVDIDGLVLTVENMGEKIQVKIDNSFDFAEIKEEGNRLLRYEQEKAKSGSGKNNSIIQKYEGITDLNFLFKAGNFVVISRLEPEEGTLTGRFVSLLNDLNK